MKKEGGVRAKEHGLKKNFSTRGRKDGQARKRAFHGGAVVWMDGVTSDLETLSPGMQQILRIFLLVFIQPARSQASQTERDRQAPRGWT